MKTLNDAPEWMSPVQMNAWLKGTNAAIQAQKDLDLTLELEKKEDEEI